MAATALRWDVGSGTEVGNSFGVRFRFVWWSNFLFSVNLQISGFKV
jgi:hypothetical protein